MEYKLIVAEKFSVGQSIAAVVGASDRHDGYLQGGGYIVTWCIGHLVVLVDADQYSEILCFAVSCALPYSL